MRSLTLIFIVAALSGCTMFSDLEGSHPFDRGSESSEADSGTDPDLAEPDEATPDADDEQPPDEVIECDDGSVVEPGDDCPDDVIECDDGSVVPPGEECPEGPDNNTDPDEINLDEYVLLIADASMQCDPDMPDPGPDLARVTVESASAQVSIEGIILVEGDASKDELQAVLDASAMGGEDCGAYVSLGCGGAVAFQLRGTASPENAIAVEVRDLGQECGLSSDDAFSVAICQISESLAMGECVGYIIEEAAVGELSRSFAAAELLP